MSFPRYEKYKGSGVEWLGEVPEHWIAGRFSRVIYAIKDGTHGTYVRTSEGRPLLSAKNIKDGDIEISEEESLISEDDHISIVSNGFPKPGDLLLTIVGTIGRSCIYTFDKPLSFQRSVCFIRLIEGLSSKFFYYFIQSKFFQEQLISRSKSAAQGGVYMGDVRATSVVYPDYFDEQKLITTFLDRETAKIDALVAEQQRLIELLKEKRQAVISHAVTKGLNPDVPMKDSGIEWLGEVPEHWIVGPVKHFFTILDGRRIPLSSEERSYKQGSFPYYGASGIIDSIDEYIFDEDLVLVSEDGANLVNRATPIAFVARGRYWVNNHAHILKPVDKYLNYWTQRIEVIDLVPFITGSAQPKLTIEALANLIIAVPPSENERAQIEQLVVIQNTQSNNLIAEAQHAIELLKERRTALISAAVTGKIDVRGLAGC